MYMEMRVILTGDRVHLNNREARQTNPGPSYTLSYVLNVRQTQIRTVKARFERSRFESFSMCGGNIRTA